MKSLSIARLMLDLASLSLFALLVVVLVSCTSRVNPGLLALVLAWMLAVCPASLCEKPPGFGLQSLLAGFPTSLFLTLTGVTLLFALVQDNGTLDRLTRRAIRAFGHRRTLVPIFFFALAVMLGTLGAGNIAPAALIAPMAMSTARRLRIPEFPMALMVAHGSIAGGMSPFGPAGAVVAGICRDKLDLPGAEWTIYAQNLIANTLLAFAGFAIFGGFRRVDGDSKPREDELSAEADTTLHTRHRFTLFLLFCVIVAVIGFGADVGMAGFAASVAIISLGLAHESRAIRNVPWAVILMVCGVSMLTAVLEQTGGLNLLSDKAATVMNATTAPALMAILCGVVSVYSSTTGVVLPAALPMIPGLLAKLGGGSGLLLASGVVVGGNVADASPLSTIGALCLAAAAEGEGRRRLFSQLLLWGLAMPFVVGLAYAILAILPGVSP